MFEQIAHLREHRQMSDIVGIDLGTTNSLIGVMEAGFPLLLPDATGERLTPSIVQFPIEGDVLVGRPAQRAQALAPGRTVTSIKRFMGLRASELLPADASLPYRLQRDPEDGAVTVQAGTSCYRPEEISAMILRKLKGDAERALGREVNRAVITVPAYFNDAQRNATRRAGELAGLTVERIINEPTAAALAYGLQHLREHAKIAVYDFGGGTFDVSILEHTHGVYEVRSTNGNTRLGGDDIDAAVMRHLANQLELVPEPMLLARLREAVVAAKHRLSTEEKATISIPFAERERNVTYELTRAELEALSRPVVDQTRSHCRRALADSGLGAHELDEVVLVGGTTRMPIVRRLVEEVFGRTPNTSQHPDEAVALGATIQAGVLSGAVQNVVLLDVTPLSLGIETFGGLMHVIIPRNSTIPIKAGEMFTTAVANQRAMSIKVLQGEREMARDNWPLGSFELEFEPAPKGVPRIGVQFEIDADGILQVLARDTRTGTENRLNLNSAVDVSDDAVESMLADSLEHAFEDVSERIWTENELKAHELLEAVKSALPLASEMIPEAERQDILEKVEQLQATLGTRNVELLKRANASLDKATEALAAALVERAISPSPQKPL